MSIEKFSIPKNLYSSKVKIALGVIFFGGMTCLSLVLSFPDLIEMLVISPIIIMFGYLSYTFLQILKREKQLLFDDEGVHSIYRQDGKQIRESILWINISKIELHCKCRMHYSDGNEIVIHCRHNQSTRFDISEFYSFEGFRIFTPKYEKRIKNNLELICKEKGKTFVLT